MSKLKDVLKEWEERTGEKAPEAKVIKLNGILPPIEKMDSTLAQLRECRQLSLSTNNIEKIGNLSGLVNLQILTLSRNQIKKIENLDAVADTLQELWISYNYVEKLAGIEKLKNLRVLYIANNKIEKWNEFERLKELPNLEELVFTGNPLEKIIKDKGDNYRTEILKRLPNLKRLDGTLVTAKDLDNEAQGQRS